MASDPTLARMIKDAIEENLEGYVNGLALDGVVVEEQKTLQQEWQITQRRLEVAPGEEILTRLFERYGLKYNKSPDSVRIARALTADEIPAEIKEIIAAASALGRPAH